LFVSPRRRRRARWLVAVVALAGAIAAVALLDPSSKGRPFVGRPPTATLFHSTPAPVAATQQAERDARGVAVAFSTAIEKRRALPGAYARLDASLRARYSLADWRAGHGLPLSFAAGDTYSAYSIAFADEKDVGIVLAFAHGSGSAAKLVALRVQKHGRRWLLAYVGQGHASSLVSEANFAPHGFYPGSTPMSTSSWLPLVLALLLLVGVAAFVERRLAR
jgi:hypothetical protein